MLLEETVPVGLNYDDIKYAYRETCLLTLPKYM